MGTKRVSRSKQTQNRKARFDVAVDETYQAGLVLTGPEVKALRSGYGVLTGSFVRVRSTAGSYQAQLVGMHIGGGVPDPERVRGLLLGRKEIDQLVSAIKARGMVVVPLSVRFVRGWAKVELGMGKKRTKGDKRNLLRERDLNREAARGE